MSSPVKHRFEVAAATSSAIKQQARKHPPPFSIRFTEDERARLDRDSGTLSLSAYIRHKLFGEAGASKQRRTRKRKTPPIDYVMLGRLLGLLGKSELASSLCLLAVAAESGALPVTDEVQDELKAACADIRDMRVVLIKALGVKP